jgi:hypothetical protein
MAKKSTPKKPGVEVAAEKIAAYFAKKYGDTKVKTVLHDGDSPTIEIEVREGTTISMFVSMAHGRRVGSWQLSTNIDKNRIGDVVFLPSAADVDERVARSLDAFDREVHGWLRSKDKHLLVSNHIAEARAVVIGKGITIAPTKRYAGGAFENSDYHFQDPCMVTITVAVPSVSLKDVVEAANEFQANVGAIVLSHEKPKPNA